MPWEIQKTELFVDAPQKIIDAVRIAEKVFKTSVSSVSYKKWAKKRWWIFIKFNCYGSNSLLDDTIRISLDPYEVFEIGFAKCFTAENDETLEEVLIAFRNYKINTKVMKLLRLKEK